MIWPYLNFVFFLVMLYFMMRKPASAFAHDQSEQYKAAAQSANASLKAATAELDHVKKQLAHLSRELEERKRKGLELVQWDIDKIEQETRLACEQIQAELKRAMAEEVTRVREELSSELVSQATEKLRARLKDDLRDSAKRDTYMTKSWDAVTHSLSGSQM
jgi:F0F1-type ATP synthase membrane subunit b/b'